MTKSFSLQLWIKQIKKKIITPTADFFLIVLLGLELVRIKHEARGIPAFLRMQLLKMLDEELLLLGRPPLYRPVIIHGEKVHERLCL